MKTIIIACLLALGATAAQAQIAPPINRLAVFMTCATATTGPGTALRQVAQPADATAYQMLSAGAVFQTTSTNARFAVGTQEDAGYKARIDACNSTAQAAK